MEGRIQKFRIGIPLTLLVFAPTVTEWLESGHFPQNAQELWTDAIVTTVIAILIIFLYRQQIRLVQLSHHDGLTNLYNRYKFQTDLVFEVERAERMGNELLLAFIDVDNFKSVNDELGHQRGDQLLINIANLLSRTLRRKFDRCYRYGGDEFVVLLPVKESENIADVTKRVSNMKKEAEIELNAYGAGLSVGLVTLQPGESAESLLKRADEVMYQEKEDIKGNS